MNKREVYIVKTNLLASLDAGQRISEDVRNNLCYAGCPEKWFERVRDEWEVKEYFDGECCVLLGERKIVDLYSELDREEAEAIAEALNSLR